MKKQTIPAESITITLELENRNHLDNRKHIWKWIWSNICAAISLLVSKLLAIVRNQR